jgi:hypothetical protein
MSNKSRHHHYLPQCYLRGFTKSGSKKSKITVFDLKRRECFETNPRNIGGSRYFNRVETGGLNPDAVENALSSFEGEVAKSLRALDKSGLFVGKDRDYILNLIALMAVRTPQERRNLERFEKEIIDLMMNMSLETKERWESICGQMERDGYGLNENVTYEDMKAFLDGKRYTIKVPTEQHLLMEFQSMDAILPFLLNRKWVLITATDESGPFITIDRPVVLMWNEPENIPPFYRNSPGFGLCNTKVLFPLSRRQMVIGSYEEREGIVTGNKEFVAVLNTTMLAYVCEQVYAPSSSFNFMDAEGNILDGLQLLKDINASKEQGNMGEKG